MKKLTISLIYLILLVQTASAFTFLNIYVDEKGQATFLGESSDSPPLPAGIEIRGSTISGKTNSLTAKQGGLWNFFYSLPDSEINLVLPKDAVIKSISNGDISIDRERISIYFINNINLTYEIDDSIATAIGVSQSTFLIIIILVAIIGVLVVFLINYSKRENEDHEKINDISNLKKFSKSQNKSKNQDNRKKIQKDKLKIMSKVLNTRENTIINALRKSGKIKQSHLRKLCEIPKASFSRHIQELEKKKLIKRSGEGKNKFVELTNVSL
ncbi:MAG: hypothetical protein Q8P57_02565 [Candidatus Pacearchaeota archaeon]|nr:hypothetical protein [Candidatus Pacearchaeota archaeon]